MRSSWILLALLCACSGVQQVGVVRPPIRKCLILATNDSESNFDGKRRSDGSYVGTIARVAAVKQRETGHGRGVILVDAGDILQGRYMERRDGDAVAARRKVLQLYEHAGYDFITLGNHEFDAGAKTLREALSNEQSIPTVVATNIESEKGEVFFASRAAVACAGLDLHMIGLLTQTVKTISDFNGMTVRDPFQVATDTVGYHGKVVVLSHLGIDEDVQLAKDVTQIDVIIGGHSHTVLDKDIVVGKTHIGQTGSRFANLAFWELNLDDNGKLDVKYHLEPIDEHLPIDDKLQSEINDMRKTLVPEVIIGVRRTTWDLVDVAHSAYVQLATRAVQAFASKKSGLVVDGALLNLGGFRSADSYPPGPVTNIDLHAIHPFKNRIVVVRLTGAQLKDVLENACTTGHSEQHGRNLASSGVEFSCDLDKPSIAYDLRDNQPIGIFRHGERVSARAGGKPLDLQKTYTIATLDYLAKGGSSYFALTQGQRTCLDGKDFAAKEGCAASSILSDVIEAAVRDGSLEAP